MNENTDMNLKKMPLTSLDIAEEKRELLKKYLAATFPEVVAEEKIDFDHLKRVLGEWAEPDRERFGLNWPGKTACMKVIQAPSVATLKPCPKESVNWDTTENLFIEGDNLEVLKLLQKAYFGKVKMIYIDPPYNTGKEFIYPDRYSETLDTYLEYTGQKDAEGRKFSTNADTSGRFHSRWLTMMYPRLYLAKNLLQEDGAIFISIDDHEQANLKSLCDFVFGEENFFCQVIVRSNSRGQTYKQIAKTHEYLLVYTKTPETELFELGKDGDKNDLNLTDDIGPYNLRELRNRNPKFGKHNRPNLFYQIFVDPHDADEDGLCSVSLTETERHQVAVEPLNSSAAESCWRWGKVLVSANIQPRTKASNVVARRRQDGTFAIHEKYRKGTYKPKSIWDENSFLNETGTVELRQLELRGMYDYPKPRSLVQQCVRLACDSEDLVLDFFAGSSTTADAVMTANLEDGTSRKFIVIQLPEISDAAEAALTAGYAHIGEVSRERIRRAGAKVTEKATTEQDVGFKVFKLDRSCFDLWQGDAVGTNDQSLLDKLDQHADHLKNSSTVDDILFELLLKDGFPLTVPVQRIQLAGKEVFSLAEGEVLICLEKELTQELIDKVAEIAPSRIICLDAGFNGNDQLKVNAAHTFKTQARNKETVIEFRTV